ncbi:MAG: hypothetical protein IJS81_04375, partial [Selenomonadaceae bacterium]|nr:hypothetical protein [Selenomonadaceae bacterium]
MNEENKRIYYPLRPMQRWIVDNHFMKARSTMMNIHRLCKFDMSIDMQKLADAVNAIFNAYDIFRCRFDFHPETNDICQRFDGEITPVTVEKISDEEFEKIVPTLTAPYKSFKEPFYRARLFETPTSKYFYIDFYHGILDGTATIILFLRELVTRYKGKTIKRVPFQYADYIAEELQTPPEMLEEGHKYFREILKDFDPKKHLIPFDVDNRDDWQKGEVECPIKNITREYFMRTKRKEHIFFLAASMLAIAKSAGATSSVMSWLHNGRVTTKEMRLMGVMIEHFPISWDFEKDNCTVGKFLDGLEEKMIKSLEYRKSLDVVYNEGIEDDTITFMFQKKTLGDVSSNLKLGDTTVEIVEVPDNEYNAAENYLNIEVCLIDDDTYTILLEYFCGVYSEQAMKNYAEIFNEMVFKLQDENQ